MHEFFINSLWYLIKNCFIKTFCLNAVAHFLFDQNYLFVFCQIFYDFINIFLIENFNFHYFSDKGINFFYQLFDDNGIIKSWSSIKQEFGFNNISNFKRHQIIDALPPAWQKIIKETDNANNLLLPNHHLIKTTH